MKTNWERSLAFVLKWEGGLIDHKNDPGGITKYGISQRSYPHLTRDDIKGMSKEFAAAMYLRDYWFANGCENMKWPLCLVAFDTAVNMGRKRWMLFYKDAVVKGKNDAEIAMDVLESRRTFYLKLATRQKFKVFLKGWLNRLNDLKKTCLEKG